MRKIILIATGIVLMQAAFAQRRSIDWNTDLDALAEGLSELHYDFFTVRSREELLAGIEAIKADTTLDDPGTALRAQQLVASFGDTHTKLDFIRMLDRRLVMPIALKWTSDGMYVVRTSAANEEILGRRVTAIGNASIETVADSLSTLVTIDNAAVVKASVPELLPSLQLLAFFGFADTRQAELTLDDGKTYVVQAIGDGGRPDVVSFRPDSLCFADANIKQFFTHRYFPGDKTEYILYNRCWNRELESEFGNREKAAQLPSFGEFGEEVFHTLNTREVDKIVFDLRYNGGGNSMPGTQFIASMAEYLNEHRQVSTYVIIGRATFSSAILNAMDFKRLTNAVFVGGQTAGKPNHFGEVRSFVLPGSNLKVYYSTKYFKRSDEELNTIEPDVKIEASFADFTSGTDPVYEWIKRQNTASQSE